MTARTTTRSDTTLYTVVPSPIDPLLLTSDGTSLTGLYMSPHVQLESAAGAWHRDDDPFSTVVEQLDAYFAGELTSFEVPLRPLGSPFQMEVWKALQTIPYGHTTSYGALARQLGNANASRAVGLANGRNPISIIVPCHRVIGSDGRLVGYGGGMPRKRFLLELEQRADRLL